MPAAKTEVWPLDRIIPYPNNPRTHPAEQISLLAKLITRHGIDQPIVIDEDGFILKGHGRRMAAVEAGLKTFPVVIHRGLSENDKRAIRLADNQVALLSGWDANLLRLELTDLKTAGFEMDLLGFDDVQLVSFMAKVPTGGDPDATPEPPKKATSRLGDVWIMGKHRLLCGDSTSKADVEKVLNGHEPNLMVSDPPYGVNYDPKWREEMGIDWMGRVQRQKTHAVQKKLTSRALGKVENDDRADWREAWRCALRATSSTFVSRRPFQTTRRSSSVSRAALGSPSSTISCCALLIMRPSARPRRSGLDRRSRCGQSGGRGHRRRSRPSSSGSRRTPGRQIRS
jgi:hypothetical protein